jgi:nitroreductase
MQPVPAVITDIDTVLSTTRAVRKRLDLSRPVDDAVLHTCLDLALQAPTASYAQNWHFLVVRDAAIKSQIAALYQQAFTAYRSSIGVLPETATTLNRVVDSASYLAEHLADVPVHVFPLVRRGSDDHVSVASAYGSIIPAAWSFMLAARSRGLGTSYTTLHLAFAHEAAAILNIDASRWVQTALLPLAYTLGTSFQPAERKTLSAVVSLNQFGTPPPF